MRSSKNKPSSERTEPTVNSPFTIKDSNESENIEVRKKAKKKSNWFNWSIPILLITTGIGVLLFYPKPDPNNIQPKITDTPVEPQIIEVAFSADSLSKELVARYFNGTAEDTVEQEKALKNTLDALHTSNNPIAAKGLKELQQSNINAAKKSLINLASKQASLEESSKTWVHIGNIQNLSSSSQALQAYKKASEIDPDNIDAYSRQGHVYRQQKQFALAEKAYKRVQSFGNQSTVNQALTLSNFGILNISKGKLVEAEDAFNQSLSIYRKIKDDEGVAFTSFNLANLFKGSERFGQAEKYYTTALNIYTTEDDFQKLADTRAALGSMYQTMKLWPKAQKQYELALELNTNNNYDDKLPEIYQNLGLIAEETGETEKAQAYFAKANGTELGEKQDNRVADQLGIDAIESRKQGNFIKAEEQHKKAIQIYQQNKSIAGTISQQINLGFLYKVWGKADLSCLVWKDTLKISERAKSNRTARVKQLVDTSCK